MLKVIALFLLVNSFIGYSRAAECRVSIKSNLLVPILLNKTNNLYEPFPNGTLAFNETQVIVAKCPGKQLQINGKNVGTSSTISCVGGLKFKVQGVTGTVNFDNIRCSDNVQSSARYTGKSCLNNNAYKEIEIGYNLGNNNYLRKYLVCFDGYNQSAVYSTFNMSGSIKAAQIRVPRPEFTEGPFYYLNGKTVNSLYVRNNQRKTINRLLDIGNNDYTVIGKTNDYFLSRGHLTAKADFVYAFDQRSTFFYVNAAPQWQTFNEGNWNELEQSVRFFVGRIERDIVVYTGTHGVATLPNAYTGKPTELHLYAEKELYAIPVPAVYWKIIYDPIAKLGTAFVGVNDPYRGDKNHRQLCADVSSQISWLRWDAKNVTAGISYACRVDDLRQSIRTIPSFIVNGLLR